MTETLRRIADSSQFQNTITLIIIFAGILVGMETYPHMVQTYGGILHTLDAIVLGIFILEIIVKMGAEGSKPWRYFLDPWNIFDFLIVAACFLPGNVQFAMVLRLVRLLRVLKLVRALPKLQILVGALLKSIPSMAYVTLLLGMMFYLYAVAAVFLFGDNDPIHFKSLQISMLSLFRAVTLEDWTDLMYIQMYGCNNYGYDSAMQLCTAPKAYPILGSLFFVSFVLLGTMIILNLFIGVIMNGMDEARAEAEDEFHKSREGQTPTLEMELSGLSKHVGELQGTIERLRREAARVANDKG